MPQIEIKTVNDLARLPYEELLPCLNALRSAIVEAKRKHAVAVREKHIAPDTLVSLGEFRWRPKCSRRLEMPAKLMPGLPIEELPVRPRVREALMSLNILCLEDLSEISEGELLQGGVIGSKSVVHLRELLIRVGLDFLPNPDPQERAAERSRAVRATAARPPARTRFFNRV